MRFKEFFLESERMGLEDLDRDLQLALSKNSLFENEFWELATRKFLDFFRARGLTLTQQGRHRLTFLANNRNVVFKVPINTYGIDDNYFEYENQNNQQWSGNRARNRIIVLPKSGIPILVMEKLNIDIPFEEMPDWAWDYDSGQVGKDRRGRFKAFDYGFH